MEGRWRRVLVVDDERFFREAIRDALASAGLECILASDGGEALERAGEPGVGAVVLDVRLPGMDGLEVLRRLRETRPSLPVIMLSAHQDQTYVLDALRQGAADYLAKPLHEEELVLAVRRALEGFERASTSERLRERLAALQHSVARLVAIARGGPEAADELRSGLAQAVAEVLGAEKTSLMLLDEAGSQLEVAAATGRKLEPQEFSAVPVGEGVAGLALARREAMLVTELSEDPRFAGRDLGERYASHCFAVAPVVAGERALGVLCATDARDGGLLEAEDLVLLRILAEQAAHLLEATRARPAQPEAGPSQGGAAPAAQAGADGELARAVCEAMAAEVEPARLLAGALGAAGPALGARCAAVYLRDPAGGELVREAAWPDGAAGDRARLAAHKGLTGAVLAGGRALASDDPAREPGFDPEADTPASGQVDPLVCLPLRFRGKTLGVFRAFLAEPGGAPPHTLPLLEAALSAAVRNVLLYRSLVESIEEVARVRREVRGDKA